MKGSRAFKVPFPLLLLWFCRHISSDWVSPKEPQQHIIKQLLASPNPSTPADHLLSAITIEQVKWTSFNVVLLFDFKWACWSRINRKARKVFYKLSDRDFVKCPPGVSTIQTALSALPTTGRYMQSCSHWIVAFEYGNVEMWTVLNVYRGHWTDLWT